MRIILAACLITGLATTGWAAGGGNGSGGDSNGGSSDKGGDGTQTPVCAKGKVYSTKLKKCVDKAKAEVAPAEILKQAWVLAKSGQFDAGRDLFEMLEPTGTPEVFNGLGYTNRKLGNFDVAFSYYNRALTLDPNYLDAREYLGEGYASIGKLDLARQQLEEIRKRGGAASEQFADLAEAIDTAVKAANAQ